MVLALDKRVMEGTGGGVYYPEEFSNLVSFASTHQPLQGQC